MLLILLFWWDPAVGTHRLVPSLLMILLLALGFEFLRRQMIREFPDRTSTSSGVAQSIVARMRERRVATAGALAAAAEPDPRIAELARLSELRESNALSEEGSRRRRSGSSAPEGAEPASGRRYAPQGHTGPPPCSASRRARESK